MERESDSPCCSHTYPGQCRLVSWKAQIPDLSHCHLTKTQRSCSERWWPLWRQAWPRIKFTHAETALCNTYGRYCCCSVTKLCPTLFDPMDCSPPGSPVHEIPQARILEWVAISFSRGSSQIRDRTLASYIGRQILYHSATAGRPNVYGIRQFLQPLVWSCAESPPHFPPRSVAMFSSSAPPPSLGP